MVLDRKYGKAHPVDSEDFNSNATSPPTDPCNVHLVDRECIGGSRSKVLLGRKCIVASPRECPSCVTNSKNKHL